MSLSQLINRPCVLTLRSAPADPADTNDYGDEIPDETFVETVCELQKLASRASEEPGDQGELSDTDWVLFLPAGTAITTGDTVTVDGEEYEMVGDPWHARNPRTQQESHLECNVRRTAGSDEEVES